mgnify:FL=1
MSVRRPYVRPMTGWWKRDPYFMRYMWREATALGVAVYSVILAVGLMRLSHGEAAWNAWVAALKSPLSIALHAVLLVCMVIHAKSWFEIMPKTMPYLHVGGKRVAGSTITRAGWWVATATTVVLWILAKVAS